MEISVKHYNLSNTKMSDLTQEQKILSVAYMLDKIVEEKVSLLSGKHEAIPQSVTYTSISKDVNDYNSLCVFGYQKGKETLNVFYQYKGFYYLYNELLPILLFSIMYSYEDTSNRFKGIRNTYEAILKEYKTGKNINNSLVKSLTKDIYEFLDNLDIELEYDGLAQNFALFCYCSGTLKEVNKPYIKVPWFED